VATDTNHARAHLSVAVGLAKNFPYLDNQTRVDYSREIKARTEKAIELDPQEDVAYHMLGRWHFEVASMNPLIKGIAKLFYGSLPKGTYDLAAANFQKAAELAPGRIIHRHELARVWLKQKRRAEAIKELQLCLTLSPADRDDREAQESARQLLTDFGALPNL
jgi:tetratricopeptide (TPR) repeat protein